MSQALAITTSSTTPSVITTSHRHHRPSAHRPRRLHYATCGCHSTVARLFHLITRLERSIVSTQAGVTIAKRTSSVSSKLVISPPLAMQAQYDGQPASATPLQRKALQRSNKADVGQLKRLTRWTTRLSCGRTQ